MNLNKLSCFGKDDIEKLKFCGDCIIRKQNKLPFKDGIHRSTSILEYLHADLWGLASTNTLSEFRFYLLIVDDFSRKVQTFLLKHKFDTFSDLKQWKLMNKNQTNKRVKALWINNGLEFCNLKFDSLCKESRILSGTQLHTLLSKMELLRE